MLLKRFLDWIHLKAKLNQIESRPPSVSEGEVWWVSIGENIGYEISGKSNLFSRPVLVYKKLSSALYFVIPLTTAYHNGDWYVSFNCNKRLNVACLHQVRTIEYRRFSSRIDCINSDDFKRITLSLKKLYL